MKKKISLIIVVLLLAIVVATGLAACNPNDGGACVHAYDNDCDTTCNLCGEVRATEHSYSTTLTPGSKTHYFECTVCGDKKDEAAHVFDNSCDADCNVCGGTREITHKYGYSCDPTCDNCGATRDSVEHIFRNDCDTDCENGCGTTRTTEHTFSETLVIGEHSHYYECSICGERAEEEPHAFDNSCDATCEVCGATREIKHVYDNSCDVDCNVCDTDREVEHTFSNDCDSSCDICGATRPVGPHDDANGDCRCDVCSSAFAHTDANADHVCDLCDFVLHADANDDGLCDNCSEAVFEVTLDYQDSTLNNESFYVVADSKLSGILPTLVGNKYTNFKGWFKNADGTGKWLNSTKVTADVTLYPGWAYNQQEVVFELNYDGAPKATKELRPLSLPLDLSKTPEREYWVFSGWYLDAGLTLPYNTEAAFTADASLTLYAAWELDPSHTHSYDKTVVDVTCTTDGYDLFSCACGHTYTENVVPATGHDLSFDVGDFFGMAVCANEGCKYAVRRDSLRIYEDVFVYNFDEEKKAEIEADFNKILSALSKADRYDQALHAYDKESEFYEQNQAFEELFDTFYGDIVYLTEQYQYAYVFYCVKQSSENVDAFLAVSDFRTEVISDFYSIYGLVYETAFREYFYDKVEGGWTDEDIEEALELSKSYGDPEYAKINNRLSEIEVRSQEISASSSEIPVLYEEFVTLKNQLAALAGYDNYLDYAYASEYGRDYTPDEAAVMRNFVKTHLVEVYKKAQSGNLTAKAPAAGSLAATYYAALKSYSIFDNATATNLVKDYFKVMNSTAGEKEIDFYYHANELFKNGNYFKGSYSGAFSYWIPAQQATILYFGPTSYSASFTFIHEFGHYYNNIYNPNASMALDIDEVHSQANEMMFLSYLEDKLPKEVLRGMYAKLYYGQLEDMLNIIMLASAVDEFEYCVYNGVTPSGEAKTYTKNDYDTLFTSILSLYGLGSGSSNYWRSVAIRSSGYYISYAMSALPCVELLSVAETEGFEAAKAIYFKFFTFTDDPNNFEVDSEGDKTATLTFGETLNYVGLHSVFDEAMYTHISSYFCGVEKDFSYPDAE